MVYNHTAEGNHLGPRSAFRGIDNAAYYRLVPDDPRYYMDYTGCGNTLNMTHPRALQLIMDSLRYWVQEMHVDGFRFDLASALARELHDVDRLSAVLRHHPPGPGDLAGQAHRRALGPGRGRLPGGQLPGWTGRSGTASTATPSAATGRATSGRSAELGYRLTGSSDLYEHGRPPAVRRASTSSPPTTASRCTTWSSYNDKHNEANGEDNRDGADDNHSWNCGVEGPTDDPAILALRERAEAQLPGHAASCRRACRCSAPATRSAAPSSGNNNAYCQDNELSWLDWRLAARGAAPARVHAPARSALRRDQPVFHRRRFFQGRRIHGSAVKDLVLVPARRQGDDRGGLEQRARRAASGCGSAGDAIEEVDERGRADRRTTRSCSCSTRTTSR